MTSLRFVFFTVCLLGKFGVISALSKYMRAYVLVLDRAAVISSDGVPRELWSSYIGDISVKMNDFDLRETATESNPLNEGFMLLSSNSKKRAFSVPSNVTVLAGYETVVTTCRTNTEPTPSVTIEDHRVKRAADTDDVPDLEDDEFSQRLGAMDGSGDSKFRHLKHHNDLISVFFL